MGERDSTYLMLERAIDWRDADVILILTALPELHPLHEEERYQRLLHRVGIPGH